MHRGFLFFLSVALWVELVAGAALRMDTGMQSSIESLQAALQSCSDIINNSDYLRDVSAPPCTETAANMEQSSEATVAQRLSEYQKCAEQLWSLCPEVSALCPARSTPDPVCQVVRLNADVVQHLNGTYQGSVNCPSSSPTPPPSDSFSRIRRSLQCVRCWSQQVAALRR